MKATDPMDLEKYENKMSMSIINPLWSLIYYTFIISFNKNWAISFKFPMKKMGILHSKWTVLSASNNISII